MELVKDYDLEELDAPGLQALQVAREKRDISRKTYLNGLRLRGVLPEDFDEDEDWEELMEEISEAMGRAGLDLDPAQKNPPEGGEGEGEGEGGEGGEGGGNPGGES